MGSGGSLSSHSARDVTANCGRAVLVRYRIWVLNVGCGAHLVCSGS